MSPNKRRGTSTLQPIHTNTEIETRIKIRGYNYSQLLNHDDVEAHLERFYPSIARQVGRFENQSQLMYCPKCATQNIDSARFCRSCGANLSLVPQALSGRLLEDRSVKVERAIEGAIKRRREPNLSRGIRKSFLGLAFLTIVAVLFITKGSPGFGEIWLLIPAFIFLGKGIAEIVTVLSAATSETQISIPRSAPSTNQLSPHQEYESLTPPSVTEATTRHMDPIPERRRESN